MRDRYHDKTISEVLEKLSKLISDRASCALIIRLLNGEIQYCEKTDK